jgi:hypothetical protein
MNPDIVIYAGNPEFESLKMDKTMEALRDRTAKIDLPDLFSVMPMTANLEEYQKRNCMICEAEEEAKKKKRKRKFRSIDDKFEVSSVD